MDKPAPPQLTPPKPAGELIDMYFLDARSHLLETAAVLDRIERARGGTTAMADPRIGQLVAACDLLKNSRGSRVEQFLHLFSDPV